MRRKEVFLDLKLQRKHRITMEKKKPIPSWYVGQYFYSEQHCEF